MHELRNLDEARRFLAEGLWLQRLTAGSAGVQPALNWALELAGEGHPLPPLGLIGDAGQLALAAEPMLPANRPVPGWPAGLMREYEDLVLGKFLADRHFERAADALRRQQGRERVRGLAFLINQFREHAGASGVLLSPAVIRGLLESPPETVLALGSESLVRDGPLPLLVELVRELVAGCRRIGEVLSAEDVFELEHGTAFLPLGQRLALRQVLQATDRLEANLPAHPLRAPTGQRDLPTAILDEDIYPVGGYASVSTRGSIESLLPSQLAYMENERDDFDLFDVKYVRDELLYYSRDENQFRRRRRLFVFALFPDLVQARCKDAELPWQRIILVLGLLVAAVRRLTEWLSRDALLFEFCLVGQEELAQERRLLEMILSTAVANGTVVLMRLPDREALVRHCANLGRRSLCHSLWIGVKPSPPARLENALVAGLTVAGPEVVVDIDPEKTTSLDPFESWLAALAQLLTSWC